MKTVHVYSTRIRSRPQTFVGIQLIGEGPYHSEIQTGLFHPTEQSALPERRYNSWSFQWP